MKSEFKILLGRKQMETVQQMLKELEKGNTAVLRRGNTLILPHNEFQNVMRMLKGDMEG